MKAEQPLKDAHMDIEMPAANAAPAGSKAEAESHPSRPLSRAAILAMAPPPDASSDDITVAMDRLSQLAVDAERQAAEARSRADAALLDASDAELSEATSLAEAHLQAVKIIGMLIDRLREQRVIASRSEAMAAVQARLEKWRRADESYRSKLAGYDEAAAQLMSILAAGAVAEQEYQEVLQMKRHPWAAEVWDQVVGDGLVHPSRHAFRGSRGMPHEFVFLPSRAGNFEGDEAYRLPGRRLHPAYMEHVFKLPPSAAGEDLVRAAREAAGLA